MDAALSQGAQGRPDTSAASFQSIRDTARTPILQAWLDANTNQLMLLAAPDASWTLIDYQREESRLRRMGFNWTVVIVPPYQDRMPVLFADDVASIGAGQSQSIDTARWALERWGVQTVVVEGLSGPSTGVTRSSRILATTRAAGVEAALEASGIVATSRIAERSVSRELAAAGPERVRAADILPFAIQ